MRRILRFIVVITLSTAAVAAHAQSSAYTIGPKDMLQVKVFEAPELNGQGRVDDMGRVSLPILGDFEVGGRTRSEVEAELRGLLESRYLQEGRATVTVEILEYRSRPINVIGAVKDPGALDLGSRWTLLEAITAAGGLAPSHGGKVFVIRTASNGLTDQIEVGIDDLFLRGEPRANLPIFAGDLVNVPEAVEVSVSCLGEVESPGLYRWSSSQRITLLAVIAQAGGLTERAARRISVRRAGPNGETQEFEVDYKQVISGRRPDPELHPGDVVFVKQSFF